MMQHVVHVTTVHPPFDTRIFHKECRTLVEAGYRVSLVAPHTAPQVVDGVEIVPVARFQGRFKRMLQGAWAAYRTVLLLRPDLCHFHDPELLPVGILLKLTTQARVVYDVHEHYPKNMQAKEWLPRPVRGFFSFAVDRFESLAAALVDGVVAATEYIAARFPVAKTRVVRNYPPLSSTASCSPRKRCYEGNRTLIYTGGLTNHRGIYQIVEALGHVRTPEVKLILVGRYVHRETEEAIQKLPGWSRVDYRGQVPHETVWQYLRCAAVGLVCNQPVHGYDLAQPTKLFEYMAAGLPVIASNFDLWREILEGHECGVTVDPTSPEEIAEAIDCLLNQPDVRRAMGKNARRAIQEEYNWEHESLKLISLVREVLHQ